MTSDEPEQHDDAEEVWVLTLRALPDDIPANVRMRRLLKIALRSLRLKCESVTGREPERGTLG